MECPRTKNSISYLLSYDNILLSIDNFDSFIPTYCLCDRIAFFIECRIEDRRDGGMPIFCSMRDSIFAENWTELTQEKVHLYLPSNNRRAHICILVNQF